METGGGINKFLEFLSWYSIVSISDSIVKTL